MDFVQKPGDRTAYLLLNPVAAGFFCTESRSCGEKIDFKPRIIDGFKRFAAGFDRNPGRLLVFFDVKPRKRGENQDSAEVGTQRMILISVVFDLKPRIRRILLEEFPVSVRRKSSSILGFDPNPRLISGEIVFNPRKFDKETLVFMRFRR